MPFDLHIGLFKDIPITPKTDYGKDVSINGALQKVGHPQGLHLHL